MRRNPRQVSCIIQLRHGAPMGIEPLNWRPSPNGALKSISGRWAVSFTSLRWGDVRFTMIMRYCNIANAVTLSLFVWTIFEMRKRNPSFRRQSLECCKRSLQKDRPLRHCLNNFPFIVECSHLENAAELLLLNKMNKWQAQSCIWTVNQFHVYTDKARRNG